MSLSLQSILGAEALAAFEIPGVVARGAAGRGLHQRSLLRARERADLLGLLGVRRACARARS